MTVSLDPKFDDTGAGHVMPAIRFAALSILAFGMLYPMLASFAGGMLFPHQAGGSLVFRNGKAVGSELVAQAFVSDRYFQARPSAADYDPRAMAGSNLAASNPALRSRMANSAVGISVRENVPATAIPADMITASGSGIDPHISPASAQMQLRRVAHARGLRAETVQAAIAANSSEPTLGVFGQPRVNVLQLNLALDAITP